MLMLMPPSIDPKRRWKQDVKEFGKKIKSKKVPTTKNGTKARASAVVRLLVVEKRGPPTTRPMRAKD